MCLCVLQAYAASPVTHRTDHCERLQAGPVFMSLLHKAHVRTHRCDKLCEKARPPNSSPCIYLLLRAGFCDNNNLFSAQTILLPAPTTRSQAKMKCSVKGCIQRRDRVIMANEDVILFIFRSLFAREEKRERENEGCRSLVGGEVERTRGKTLIRVLHSCNLVTRSMRICERKKKKGTTSRCTQQEQSLLPSCRISHHSTGAGMHLLE